MYLLDDSDALELYDDTTSFKIYSEDTKSLPQYIGPHASVKNSMINQGSIVCGKVEHSVIFTNVVIENDCEIIDSVIMPNSTIMKGSKIYKAIVAPNSVIEGNRVINQDAKEVILVEK